MNWKFWEKKKPIVRKYFVIPEPYDETAIRLYDAMNATNRRLPYYEFWKYIRKLAEALGMRENHLIIVDSVTDSHLIVAVGLPDKLLATTTGLYKLIREKDKGLAINILGDNPELLKQLHEKMSPNQATPPQPRQQEYHLTCSRCEETFWDTSAWVTICDNCRQSPSLFKAAEKVIDCVKQGEIQHSPLCNYQSIHNSTCNCGLADLNTALNIAKSEK